MKNLLIVLAALVTTTNISAQQEMPQFAPATFEQPNLDFKPIYRSIDFIRTDSVHNGNLTQNEAIYHFDFVNLLAGDSIAIVHYSIDTTEYWKPMKAGRLSIKTTPGVHSFQLYVNANYWEAASVGLTSTPQCEFTYQVILQQRMAEQQIISYKPVIYLYPTKETDVTVQVNIKDGSHHFYYPNYNDYWECTASPNGALTVHGEQYRYLFWEALQNDHLKEIEVDEGFVVEGTEAISFLEDKLSTFGLTAAEQADFITFWGPKIAQSPQNLIRFEWNETCDKFADLTISPQPDHVYRVYIFVAPLDGILDIQPQVIPTMDRSGFTVLEWGGQLSNYQPNTAL